MTDIPDLKPCPFCNGEVFLEQPTDRDRRFSGPNDWWGVICRNTLNRGGTCAIYQRPSRSKEAAVSRWNMRGGVSDPECVKMHERMDAEHKESMARLEHALRHL